MVKAKTKASDLDSMMIDAGLCLCNNRLSDAVEGYRKILAQQAKNRIALFNVAQALRELGQEEESKQFEKRFLALEPSAADIEIRNAYYLTARTKYDEAIASYRKAFEMGRKDYDVYRGWGDAYLDNGNPVEALKCYEKAQKLNPRDASLQALMADAHFALSQFQDAIAHAEKAMAMSPELARPKTTAAWAHLILGNYEKGLKLNEERFAYKSREWLKRIGLLAQVEQFADKPRWQGEDLQGKTILIWMEQGLGDAVMMARYIPMLKEKGASGVVIFCYPALIKTMLKFSPLVVSTETPLDKRLFDVHCSIMSLPFCFGTRVESIPAPIPYLTAEPSAQKAWGRGYSVFPA
jgi:tetratricopeptide (TPR) repeat protein